MNTIDALADSIFVSVKSYLEGPLGEFANKLADFDRRIAAIPAGAKGDAGMRGEPGAMGERGIPGADGKDGRDGIDGKDGALGLTGNNGRDGADGKDGVPGIAGNDGRDGVDGKDGAPGRDGKDIDPALVEQVAGKLAGMDATATRLAADVATFNALPVAPNSFLINDGGELVAVYPDGATKHVGIVRGKDGMRGASVMDGSVDAGGQLILRMSDNRIINAGAVRGEPGRDGVAGLRGRDATEIKPLAGIDETRSYAEGVYARYRGGMIRAERQTDPMMKGDLAEAGWSVALEGITEEIERALDDGRQIERTTTYTSGKAFTRRITTAAMVWRDVWTDGEYLPGDVVTRDGSMWHCQCATRAVPGSGTDWKLCVKRGANGKDGKDGSGL